MSLPKIHLYVHKPAVLFKARVNMPGAITYPVSELTYDTVTSGAYANVYADQTLLLGTTEGADDLGRVRVKHPATATTIFIARSGAGVEDGTLLVQDNAYITVLDDYRVWAKIPYFDLENKVDFKDGDLAVGDFNTEIPPVANAGPGMAGFIDSVTGKLRVTFPVDSTNTSFTLATGATIASYGWDLRDGTLVSGGYNQAVITADFPPGFRWVALTVTDSNGKSHTARCPVLSIDPLDNPCITDFTASQRLEMGKQSLDLEIFSELPIDDYPDGTLVMLWWGAAASPDDRSHMKFIGWLDGDSFKLTRKQKGLNHSYQISCLDVAGRLEKLPGFAQALSRVEDESPWSYMPGLTMRRSLAYLLFWHSTALSVADLDLPMELDAYTAMRLDSGAASLLNQVADQASKLIPDHILTCNSKGQLAVQRDWMYDDPEDRPDVDPYLSVDDWTDISFSYNRSPRVHVLRSGAVLCSTALTLDSRGDETVPVVFSIAPGDAGAFGQGTVEQTENEGLALSQDDLNRCKGHRFALLNARIQEVKFQDSTRTNIWSYEPALLKRLELEYTTKFVSYRNLPKTNLVGQVQTVDLTYVSTKNGTIIRNDITLKPEVDGEPAITYEPPDTEDVGYTPPAVNPEDPNQGLEPSQKQLIGISPAAGYRTSDFTTTSAAGGPRWEAVNFGLGVGEEIHSFVVDPFSPGYIGTGTRIDGYFVTNLRIFKASNLFGTVTVSTLHTFTVYTSSGGVSTSKRRTIQASFGTYFASGSNPWLMVVSHYGSTTGKNGTYAIYSLDAGATWSSEVQVSSYYSTASIGTLDSHPGLYLSPKTPGYALTFAYHETGSTALASGYVSYDWGATWTRLMASEDTAKPLPLLMVRDSDGLIAEQAVSNTMSLSLYVENTDGLDYSGTWNILIAPPNRAKKITLSGSWTNTFTSSSAYNGLSASLSQVQDTLSPNEVSDLAFVRANANTTTSQNFTTTWTRGVSQTSWAGDREQWEGGDTTYTKYCRLAMAVGVSGTAEILNGSLTVTITVTEIELDTGVIYTPTIPVAIDPGNLLGGDVHVPWEDNADEGIVYYGHTTFSGGNRQHRLKKLAAGVAGDISPSSGGVNYGGFFPHFTIRAFDGDRNYLALAGLGSDGTGNGQVGLWLSEDAGATWVQKFAPFSVNDAEHGLHAAFSGSSRNSLYLWGGESSAGKTIYYTSNFGTSFDNRQGNLQSLASSEGGSIHFIGIAGGPV